MTAYLSQTMQARTQWGNSCKVHSCQPGTIDPEEMSFKIKGKIETLAYIQKQKECMAIIQNDKGSPSSKRKMISKGNLDLSRGMENTRNGKYIGGYKRYFSYFLNQLKG